MLVIKNVPKDAEGKWFYRDLWGVRFGVKVRPRTDDIIEQIKENIPESKQGEERAKAVNDAVWDHIIEDFTPLGKKDPAGIVTPIAKTPEGKQEILKIDVPSGEKSILDWVIDNAAGMGYEVLEDERKN